VRALRSGGSKGVKFRSPFMRPFAPCFASLVSGAQVYLLIRDHCVPDTTTCDSGHRPGVLKHCMIKGYNDRCDQSSSSLVAEHRADVGGESRYRVRASGRDPYSR
jgi:hypothetical protein